MGGVEEAVVFTLVAVESVSAPVFIEVDSFALVVAAVPEASRASAAILLAILFSR